MISNYFQIFRKKRNRNYAESIGKLVFLEIKHDILIKCVQFKKDWDNERGSRINEYGGISYVLWEWITCWKTFWMSGRNFEQHQGMEERFIWGKKLLEGGFWHLRKPFQHYIHLVIINSLMLRPCSFSWMPFQILC